LKKIASSFGNQDLATTAAIAYVYHQAVELEGDKVNRKCQSV